MSKPLKHLPLALLATTVGLGTAQAQSLPPQQPVVVGVLDMHTEKLPKDDPYTSIEYREFTMEGRKAARWPVNDGLDHGQLVIGTFVDQVRKIDKNVPIKIVSANFFVESKQPPAANLLGRKFEKPNSADIGWKGAFDALEWFHQKGVKVVLTSFVGNDTPVLRGFMAKAEKLGMVVFASAGNKLSKGFYPAKYPEAISVAADNKDMSFNKDPSIGGWVDFTMDGYIKRGRDTGSSFAVSKAAAFGAYYAAYHPEANRADIKRAIDLTANAKTYEVQGVTVNTRYVDQDASALMMNRIAMAPIPSSMAKGPTIVTPDVAAVQLAQASQGR